MNIRDVRARMVAKARGWRGLGDVIAEVAEPIRHNMNRAFPNVMADCDGCKARQDWLNRAFPFGRR